MSGALCALALVSAALAVPGQSQGGPLFVDSGLSIGNDAACWADLDNDGWTDLCAGGTAWRNNGGKSLQKLAEVGSVVAGDYDNDGFLDLFSWTQMRLYHNEAGKGFVAVPLPPLPPTVSRGACWGDFNGDGFLDLYVGGFEDWDKDVTYPNLILINHSGHGFELSWQETKYRSRGVTACDFDRDGDLDVYVSNYRLQPNVLRLNNGFGEFRDAAPAFNVVATSPGFEGGHSIGAAWADFDNDGEFDLFAGNFAHQDDRGDQPKSRFLRNLGRLAGHTFEDKGTCGVFYQESYASPSAGDFDNDGDMDLFFTTVYAPASFNKANNPVLFENSGKFVFRDATTSAGLSGLPPTYQSAWADFNNDGHLDLATAGKIFINTSKSGHWIEVALSGDGRVLNRSAIGTQVRVRTKNGVLTRHVEAGTGEGNQNDLRLHFGLGDSSSAVDLEVTWPNGKTKTLRRVKVDRLVKVTFRR